MKFCVLASGSKGNATWIQEGDEAILIDNGLSAKDLKARAKERGLLISKLRAVVVTHEHHDHVHGIGPLARQERLVVWATSQTVKAAGGALAKTLLKNFQVGQELTFGSLTISTIPTSHDAADPLAVVAQSKTARLGLVTDLGVVTHLVRESLKNLNALVVEFNHDLVKLIEGPYPFSVKQRVRGRMGHLSNEQGAELLTDICHPGLGQVVLGHISGTNNSPELALSAAGQALERLGHNATLLAADQRRPTPVFEL
ncbi:MAG: MBL fold metallo-hydrolase [Deltaproteobacteria bacterium]|jgi:phosphoribosyl 1,2-cyclic phosphodiesterase|nr:MBL fold metallo-hydrolase [Deltaproteobacteria bacterium]